MKNSAHSVMAEANIKKSESLNDNPEEFNDNSEEVNINPGASLLEPEVLPVVVKENPGERIFPHILTVCQKFLILFLVIDKPTIMSLEFASKVE